MGLLWTPRLSQIYSRSEGVEEHRRLRFQDVKFCLISVNHLWLARRPDETRPRGAALRPAGLCVNHRACLIPDRHASPSTLTGTRCVRPRARHRVLTSAEGQGHVAGLRFRGVLQVDVICISCYRLPLNASPGMKPPLFMKVSSK